MTAISQEQAAELQAAYHAKRRAHAADPKNGLHPWPLRRTKRLPQPGELPMADEENG